MRKTRIVAKLAGVVVTAAALPIVVGAASPAHADCTLQWKNYAPNLVNSAEFRASHSCDGLWAWQAYAHTDTVRGRFYVSGEWEKSDYGWKEVMTAPDSGGKIIGNTVTNRRLKGQSIFHNQAVKSKY